MPCMYPNTRAYSFVLLISDYIKMVDISLNSKPYSTISLNLQLLGNYIYHKICVQGNFCMDTNICLVSLAALNNVDLICFLLACIIIHKHFSNQYSRSPDVSQRIQFVSSCFLFHVTRHNG